jgi:hypothetical protein
MSLPHVCCNFVLSNSKAGKTVTEQVILGSPQQILVSNKITHLFPLAFTLRNYLMFTLYHAGQHDR